MVADSPSPEEDDLQTINFVSPESSVMTSVHRESTATFNMQSTYDFEEPSTRISVALSDGEIGIGLSLLQDIADGGAARTVMIGVQ